MNLELEIAELRERVKRLEKLLPAELVGEAVKITAAVVSRHFKVPARAINSPCRRQSLVLSRWAVMWLLQTRFGWTKSQIARLFHRHPGTVSHAFQCIDGEREHNKIFREQLERAEADLDWQLKEVAA